MGKLNVYAAESLRKLDVNFKFQQDSVKIPQCGNLIFHPVSVIMQMLHFRILTLVLKSKSQKSHRKCCLAKIWFQYGKLYIVYLTSERAVWLLRWYYNYRCNSDHIASLPIISVTGGGGGVQNQLQQYHGPGELSSFFAIGHLLVITEVNLPYHIK